MLYLNARERGFEAFFVNVFFHAQMMLDRFVLEHSFSFNSLLIFVYTWLLILTWAKLLDSEIMSVAKTESV